VQVLSDARVTRFQQVKPRGEPFGASSDRAVRLLALRVPVFLLGGPATRPRPPVCLDPFLLRNLTLEMGKESWKRHSPHLHPVKVAQAFHPPGVWLLRRNLCPFVDLLIAGNSLVCWAPPDLDDNSRSSPPQRGDVLPCLDRVLLAGARLLQGHPPSGCLGVRKDRDPLRRCLLS